MKHASTIELDRLIELTSSVMDRLIRGAHRLLVPSNGTHYQTDMSDTITGVEGIHVFLYQNPIYRHGNLVEDRIRRLLQVNGPESLMVELEKKYTQYKVVGSKKGHRVFMLDDGQQ